MTIQSGSSDVSTLEVFPPVHSWFPRLARCAHEPLGPRLRLPVQHLAGADASKRQNPVVRFPETSIPADSGKSCLVAGRRSRLRIHPRGLPKIRCSAVALPPSQGSLRPLPADCGTLWIVCASLGLPSLRPSRVPGTSAESLSSHVSTSLTTVGYGNFRPVAAGYCGAPRRGTLEPASGATLGTPGLSSSDFRS